MGQAPGGQGGQKSLQTLGRGCFLLQTLPLRDQVPGAKRAAAQLLWDQQRLRELTGFEFLLLRVGVCVCVCVCVSLASACVHTLPHSSQAVG